MTKQQRNGLRDRIVKQCKGEYMVGPELLWLLDAVDEAERLRDELAGKRATKLVEVEIPPLYQRGDYGEL